MHRKSAAAGGWTATALFYGPLRRYLKARVQTAVALPSYTPATESPPRCLGAWSSSATSVKQMLSGRTKARGAHQPHLGDAFRPAPKLASGDIDGLNPKQHAEDERRVANALQFD